MKLIKTNLPEKKDQFNAMQGGTTLESMKGNVIDVEGYVLYEREENEEEITVCTFKLTDGTFVGGKSTTVIKSLDSYVESFGDDAFPASFEVVSDKGKSGREFLQLKLV